MESRIPKRPISALKSMIPTDRIRAANPCFPNKVSTLTEPYRDLTNLQLPKVAGRQRAPSPEMRSTTVPHSRVKMRRSRSACDIAVFRRQDIPPAKLPRLNEAVVPTNLRTVPTNSRTVRAAGFSATNPTAVAKTGFGTRTAQTSTTNTAVKKATTSTAAKATTTSASTTGAAKPINKRIPPYDFKARYHDLLEKFKSLKEKFEQKSEALSNLENLSEQLEEFQTELFTTKETLKNTTTENESLRLQVQNYEIKAQQLSSSLAATKSELETLKSNHEIISAEHTELTTKVEYLGDNNKMLTDHNKQLQEEILQCKEQLFRFNMERKELHNALMDLRGNIRVFCRVRPPLPYEQEKAVCGWNYIDEATVEVLNHDLLSKNKPGAHTFNFDYVFHPGCRQEDVFEMVSPLIQSAMDGYNICIFAYGQTGSGKTYTMDGLDSNVGVIPRTVDLIFQSVENYKCLGWQYTIKATFLEIYNEVLYDLLSNEQKDMEIRMAKNNKNEIYVSNITEETVLTADHLRRLMGIAKMNRATAATIGNDRSSRSHAVTRIELIGFHEEKNEISVGTVNLVDLAGSESPKTSLRMNETKNINRSLSELTNVILALLQKHDHIPYRNSKLTHLLMPALGGNSKTLMFINVAPFLDCYVESVKSLRFAASVNSCKVTKAKRNRFLNTSNSSGSFDK